MNQSIFFIKKLSIDEIAEYQKKFEINAFTNYRNFGKMHNINYYMMFNNKSAPLCLWPIAIKNRTSYIPKNFYYFGPLFNRLQLYKLNNFNLKLALSIINDYLRFFSMFLNEIKFSTKNLYLKQILDELTKKKKFNVLLNLKNSALIDIKKNYKFRNNRLRMLKSFQNNYLKNFLISTKQENFKDVEKLAIETFTKQNKLYSENISYLKKFLSIKNSNIIKLFFKDKKSLKLKGFIYLLKDSEYIHLVYNFSEKHMKSKGLMVFMINEVLKICKENNLVLDFNGSNSFVGTDDKISYGAKLLPYLELKIEF